MSNLLSPLSSLPPLNRSAPLVGDADLSTSGRSVAFRQVLANAASPKSVMRAQEGDTLIGLVKAHYRQNQQPISESQALRLAQQVAAHNQIENPNLILKGQKIDFAVLQMPALARANPPGPLDLNPKSARFVRQLQASGEAPLTGHALATRPTWWNASAAAQGSHPVLERTLSRAVAKGFVPASQLPAVRDKVMALAERYNFKPDDFARLTLMESGGMNPQATNGNCHGIIQFCDGENRGAASVGLKDNPRSILGMGLLKQLDLVDRYFSQAGLRVKGPPLGLDDLYLTVLTPAAKRETRPDAPLPIAGPQARDLHVGQDTSGPITRNSILAGLHRLTDALMQALPAPANAVMGSASKKQITRLYEDVAQGSPATLR